MCLSFILCLTSNIFLYSKSHRRWWSWWSKRREICDCLEPNFVLSDFQNFGNAGWGSDKSANYFSISRISLANLFWQNSGRKYTYLFMYHIYTWSNLGSIQAGDSLKGGRGYDSSNRPNLPKNREEILEWLSGESCSYFNTLCPYIYLLFFFRELQLLVVGLCSVPQIDSNFPAEGIKSHL